MGRKPKPESFFDEGGMHSQEFKETAAEQAFLTEAERIEYHLKKLEEEPVEPLLDDIPF